MDPAIGVALQRKAQERVGMWKRAYCKVVTSLHSANERSDRKQAYDRAVIHRRGADDQHTENYEVCQESATKAAACSTSPTDFDTALKRRAACAKRE